MAWRAAPELLAKEGPAPFDGHYLVLVYAPADDEGSWNDDLDWELSHPPSCPGHVDDVVGWTWDCGFQHEVDMAGVEAFRYGVTWPAMSEPAVIPIVTWLSISRHWELGDEIDTGICPHEPALWPVIPAVSA